MLKRWGKELLLVDSFDKYDKKKVHVRKVSKKHQENRISGTE